MCSPNTNIIPQEHTNNEMSFTEQSRIVSRAIERKHARNRKKYQGNKVDTFKKDDLVLVENVEFPKSGEETPKFFLLYRGPYKVAKAYTNNSYKITTERGRKIGTYNVRRLKKYNQPSN